MDQQHVANLDFTFNNFYYETINDDSIIRFIYDIGRHTN